MLIKALLRALFGDQTIPQKDVQVAQKRGRGNSGNARKKTFIFFGRCSLIGSSGQKSNKRLVTEGRKKGGNKRSVENLVLIPALQPMHFNKSTQQAIKL